MTEMVELMQRLIAAGHATKWTATSTSDVRSWREYGNLSGQRVDEMAGEPAAAGKRDPLDFTHGRPPSQGSSRRGAAAAGLAPRVLGDGNQVLRR